MIKMIANMTSDCSFDFKTRFGKPPAVPGRCRTAAKVTQFSSKKRRKKPFANRIREFFIYNWSIFSRIHYKN